MPTKSRAQTKLFPPVCLSHPSPDYVSADLSTNHVLRTQSSVTTRFFQNHLSRWSSVLLTHTRIDLYQALWFANWTRGAYIPFN